MMSSWSGWRSTMVCGRLAQLPAEQSRRRHPDLAGGHQRLGQHLERAGLRKVGGPALQVGLRREPAVELDVPLVGAASNGCSYTQSGDGASDEALIFLLNHNLAPNLNLSKQFKIKIKKLQNAEERFYASFGQMGTN